MIFKSNVYINIVFLLILVKASLCSHIGSCLFHNRATIINDCWNENDIAKLRARKVLERSIPPMVAPEKVDSAYIKNTLKYFRRALRLVNKNYDEQTGFILKEALADTIGSHMRSEILPAARFSYYAGFAPYRSVRDLHNFYDSLKLFLNTQGLGWRKPESVPFLTNLTVEKIRVGAGRFINPCTIIVTKRDKKSCIHIPKPKIDDYDEPSAIALPFKSNGLVSLTSAKSENAILKYYTTASRCILKRSTNSCRHDDFVSFNNELWHWMKREVAPHLIDEKVYTAYGGILRVAAAVQSYGKDISRRNIFSFDDSGVSIWHPWKALTESYVNINAESSRCFYIGAILFFGVTICLLQICYSLIFGDGKGCHCRGKSKTSSFYKDVAYANVESSFPAMLPSHKDNVFYDEEQTIKPTATPSKIKTSSMSSGMTQKVHDLHVNREQIMDVIVSENDETSDESTSMKTRQVDDNIIDVGLVDRSRSPPKIETSVDEIKIIKRRHKLQAQAYSTSTVTFQAERGTDTVWSATDSSSEEDSVSSESSKSRCPRSSSRSLAWARHVVKKHTRSTTGTELDGNSFTTPPNDNYK